MEEDATEYRALQWMADVIDDEVVSIGPAMQVITVVGYEPVVEIRQVLEAVLQSRIGRDPKHIAGQGEVH